MQRCFSPLYSHLVEHLIKKEVRAWELVPLHTHILTIHPPSYPRLETCLSLREQIDRTLLIVNLKPEGRLCYFSFLPCRYRVETCSQLASPLHLIPIMATSEVVTVPVIKGVSDGDELVWPTDPRYGKADTSVYRKKLAIHWIQSIGAQEIG